jgi:transposase
VLTLPPSVRVFLAVEAIDMRGSFDALAGRVRALGLDPSDGHLYLFLSRRGHLAKCLYFDRSGWVVWQKRLLRGSFQRPVVPAGTSRVTLDAASLSALLDGIDLRAPRRRWYRYEVHMR